MTCACELASFLCCRRDICEAEAELVISCIQRAVLKSKNYTPTHALIPSPTVLRYTLDP